MLEFNDFGFYNGKHNIFSVKTRCGIWTCDLATCDPNTDSPQLPVSHIIIRETTQSVVDYITKKGLWKIVYVIDLTFDSKDILNIKAVSH